MQRNVLILTYWSFDDPLIQTYTLPYLRIIRKHLAPNERLVLFTLEKQSPGHTDVARINKALQPSGIEWIHGRYFPFGFRAAFEWGSLLTRLRFQIRRREIGTLHCWGTPAGAIGYLLSVLTGARLIVDSFEPHAEAMVENGTWSRTGLAFRLLFAMEKRQTRRADFLIAANAGMRDYVVKKFGITPRRLLSKPACVDLEKFQPAKGKDTVLLNELGLNGKRVAVYAGKLGGIYLDKEVFDFLKAAHDRWGERFGALLLTSHSEAEINSFCHAAGLARSVVVTRFVPHHEVPRYLALADFALTPVKPVPTKRYCTPVKDGEYWAMGLPVVITKGISDDSDIIHSERIGAVLDGLDGPSYNSALDTLDELLASPQEGLRNRIRGVAVRFRDYSLAEDVYRQVYGN